MEYSEILKDILAGKWVRPHTSHRWKKLREDGLWDTYPPSKKPSCCDDLDCCIEEKEVEPKTMSPHYMRQNKWEVKPEEIFIYGACDHSGQSFAYNNPPREKSSKGHWQCDNKTDYLKYGENNLFPTDKPQKYKLVPVED